MAKLTNTTIYGSANITGSVVMTGNTFDISANGGISISNANSITSVLITNIGTGYQSIPSVVFSNTTTGGATANANVIMRLSGTIGVGAGYTANVGSGYANGDYLFANVAGSIANAVFLVTSNTATTYGPGGINGISVINYGQFYTLPNFYNSASVANTGSPYYLQITGTTSTAGAGANVQISSSGFAVSAVNFQSQGSGYVEPATVTFSGGSPSTTATGYPYIGGITNIRSLGTATNFYQGLQTNPAFQVADNQTTGGYWQIANGTTGGQFFSVNTPSGVAVIGTGSGTAGILFRTNFTFNQFGITHTASSVNYVNVTGAATGGNVVVSAAGTDTNISLVLQPKGLGSLQAQPGDGTITNGNPRGNNAVDFQVSRTVNSMVASGINSTLVGGFNNTSGGTATFVGGGSNNQALTQYSVVVGGINNFASGSNFNAIVGGQNNSITGSPTWGFIGGGLYNSVGFSTSSVVGGHLNIAQGFLNFIGGGESNLGTSSAAVALPNTTIAIASGSATLYFTGPNTAIRVGMLVTTNLGLSGPGSSTNWTYATTPMTTGTPATASYGLISNGANTASGNTFTPLGTITGQFIPGMVLTGTGVSPNTYITSNNTVSFVGAITGTTLTYTSGSNPNVGMVLVGTGITGNTFITTNTYPTYTVSQSSAATGSITITGISYNVSANQWANVANTTLTGTAYTVGLSQPTNAITPANSIIGFYVPHGVVVGGGNNIANASYSFVGGGGDASNTAYGNKATSDWTVIGGGWGNYIGPSSHGSVIAGGGYQGGVNGASGSIINGLANFIGGGYNHNITGGSSSSVISGGESHQIGSGGVAATKSFIGSGRLNLVTGSYSAVVNGYGVNDRGVTGTHAFNSGLYYSSRGDTQASSYVLSYITTTGTVAALTTTSGLPSLANIPVVQAPNGTTSNNTVYTFRGLLSARDAGSAAAAGWEIKGVIQRTGSAASTTALVGSPTITLLGANAQAIANTWGATGNVTVTADTTYGGISVNVQGPPAANTIRWVCRLDTSEVS